MASWFEVRRKYNCPVIGIESDGGELLGFASYGPFRPFDGYKYTIEHSVYVRDDHCGKGLGSKLLKELIKKAEQQNYHIMIGCIDAGNQGSIAFHERLGFVNCGTMKEVGYKFGAWRDVVFCQLTLKTPANPVED
jgi:phosphinothricin acetyltransferase